MRLQNAFVKKSHIRAIALAAFAALPIFASGATGAEIKVLASANSALQGALTELATQFEGATGHRLNIAYGSALPLKRIVDAGEPFDILIAPVQVHDSIERGKVVPDTRAILVRTGLGVGVARGTPKPDVGSVDALKRTLLAAVAVGYQPDSEPGMLFLATLDRLGIAQDVRPRLKVYPTLAPMAAALDAREIAFAVSSITNLATVMDVVAFPREAQSPIETVIGLSATTQAPEAAKALVRFLLSPPAVAVFVAKGFERE